MTQHTAGPWMITPYRSKRDGSIRSVKSNIYICEVMDTREREEYEVLDTFDPIQQCNKALIAAAPDLLAACELALMYFQHHGLGYVLTEKTIKDDLSAAIAKARGE